MVFIFRNHKQLWESLFPHACAALTSHGNRYWSNLKVKTNDSQTQTCSDLFETVKAPWLTMILISCYMSTYVLCSCCGCLEIDPPFKWIHRFLELKNKRSWDGFIFWVNPNSIEVMSSVGGANVSSSDCWPTLRAASAVVMVMLLCWSSSRV